MKRFAISLVIGTVTLLIGLTATCEIELTLATSGCNSTDSDRPWRCRPTLKPHNLTPVPDDTKAELVELIYADPKSFKDVVDDDRTLYLMVSESLFSKLPKQIRGVTLKRVTSEGITKDFHHAYVEFNGWDEVDNTISVDDAAHFWGGNEGWCNRKFERSGYGFKELTPTCGASAS